MGLRTKHWETSECLSMRILCHLQGPKGNKGDPGQKVQPVQICNMAEIPNAHTFLKFRTFCVATH